MRAVVMFLLLCIAVPAWAEPALNTVAKGCARAGLQKLTNQYLDAQKKLNPTLMPLAPQAKYIERRKEVPLGRGLWQKPFSIDFSRSIFDVDLGSVTGRIDSGGKKGLPDAHTFRLENWKLRFMHMITLYPNGCPEIPAAKQ